MNEPGLDPQARRLLAMVALGAAKGAYASIEERRRSFEKLMRFSQPPTGEVCKTDVVIPTCRGEIPMRIYVPHGAPTTGAGLVYFHGGGLVAGSIETHESICASLALEAGCRVHSVGYRLAPEYPFPTAVVDALCATRWIAHHSEDFGLDALAVGGDSGGATLAAIVCQVMCRSAMRRSAMCGRWPIKAQVLLCPVLDFAGTHPSRAALANGFMLDAETMARDLDLYAPTRPLADPRISPLQQTCLAGMPPTLIHTAGFDPLRDEGAAYAARLLEAGVAVEHVCHESLIHHFYGLTGAIPAARIALSAIAAGLSRILD